MPQLDKKLKSLEAGDCAFVLPGRVVNSKRIRNKNSPRKPKNKFGNIDKGYLHININPKNCKNIKQDTNNHPKVNSIHVKDGVDLCSCRKLNGFKSHNFECQQTSTKLIHLNQPCIPDFLLKNKDQNLFSKQVKGKIENNKMDEEKDKIQQTLSAESVLRNDTQPRLSFGSSIIKPTNLLESGIEIESVNCLNNLSFSNSEYKQLNSSNYEDLSSLASLAVKHEATRQHEIELPFSLDDMVSDLLKDDDNITGDIDNFRSPKRLNSELEIDNRNLPSLGVKKRLSSDEITTLVLNEDRNDDIPVLHDSFSNRNKYSQSIDSDDEEHFSLAHLAAKHDKSKNVKHEHEQMLSLDDLVSKHFKSDDKLPVLGVQNVSADSDEESLDRLASQHLNKSNIDNSSCIANLTSKHLKICDTKSSTNTAENSPSTSFLGSPVSSAPSLFDATRTNLSSTNVFGTPNSSPKNIFGSPNRSMKNSNTLLGSPNLPVLNIFGNPNTSPKNIFGNSNSPKNSTYDKPNSFTKAGVSPLAADLFHFKPAVSQFGQSPNLFSMSPKYFSFGSSDGSTKVDFENDMRQRTISSDSRDQEIFDDVDDICFFEPTINLSSALLPSVIGENRTTAKKMETGILDRKWTSDLNNALSPNSDIDVLINQDDWKLPSLMETSVIEPIEECCIDAKSILKIKLKLRARKCSSFGKIICKKVNKSTVVPYKEESVIETNVIQPFAFNCRSPDDEILKHFIRRL